MVVREDAATDTALLADDHLLAFTITWIVVCSASPGGSAAGQRRI